LGLDHTIGHWHTLVDQQGQVLTLPLLAGLLIHPGYCKSRQKIMPGAFVG